MVEGIKEKANEAKIEFVYNYQKTDNTLTTRAWARAEKSLKEGWNKYFIPRSITGLIFTGFAFSNAIYYTCAIPGRFTVGLLIWGPKGSSETVKKALYCAGEVFYVFIGFSFFPDKTIHWHKVSFGERIEIKTEINPRDEKEEEVKPKLEPEKDEVDSSKKEEVESEKEKKTKKEEIIERKENVLSKDYVDDNDENYIFEEEEVDPEISIINTCENDTTIDLDLNADENYSLPADLVLQIKNSLNTYYSTKNLNTKKGLNVKNQNAESNKNIISRKIRKISSIINEATHKEGNLNKNCQGPEEKLEVSYTNQFFDIGTTHKLNIPKNDNYGKYDIKIFADSYKKSIGILDSDPNKEFCSSIESILRTIQEKNGSLKDLSEKSFKGILERIYRYAFYKNLINLERINSKFKFEKVMSKLKLEKDKIVTLFQSNKDVTLPRITISFDKEYLNIRLSKQNQLSYTIGNSIKIETGLFSEAEINTRFKIDEILDLKKEPEIKYSISSYKYRNSTKNSNNVKKRENKKNNTTKY